MKGKLNVSVGKTTGGKDKCCSGDDTTGVGVALTQKEYFESVARSLEENRKSNILISLVDANLKLIETNKLLIDTLTNFATKVIVTPVNEK